MNLSRAAIVVIVVVVAVRRLYDVKCVRGTSHMHCYFLHYVAFIGLLSIALFSIFYSLYVFSRFECIDVWECVWIGGKRENVLMLMPSSE